jgi:hypothetical protein
MSRIEAFGQDNKPFGLIRALDDLHVQMRANFGQRGAEFRSLITTVGEQLLKKGTLDFLAGVVTRRIDAGPPFSALFTLWLSMMAAVGLASRCACSRHCS